MRLLLYVCGEKQYVLRMASFPPKAAFLRQSNISELLLLFDFMPDTLFFVKNRAGCFMALNPRLCEYCGVRAEHEAIGRTDYDFFPKARADQYTSDDREVMTTGRPLVNRVEGAPECGGSRHLVSTTKLPLRDRQGEIIGLMGFARPLDALAESNVDADRLRKVVERMHQEPSATIPSTELARMAGLSVSQFDRRFQSAFGMSPRNYLLRVRVEDACRRLARSDEKIVVIAQECGFYDHAHFARSFRKLMGVSPAAYRQAHQHPEGEALAEPPKRRSKKL
jgi:AraC-like DNA-binding protein